MRRVCLLVVVFCALSAAPSALAGVVREARGEIVSIDATGIAVRGSTVLRCGFSLNSPRPAGLRAGDTIGITCVGDSDHDAGDPPFLLAAISGKDGKPRPGRYVRREDSTVYVEGVVKALGRRDGPRSVTSVTIRPLNWEPPVTCGVHPQSPLGAIRSEGALVRLMCVGDEARALDRVWSVDATDTVVSGRVAAVTPTRISIRPLFGGADPVSCRVDARSPSVESFAPGVRASIHCGMTRPHAFERVLLLETASRLWVKTGPPSHPAGLLKLQTSFGDRFACSTATYALPAGLSWSLILGLYDMFDCRRRAGGMHLTATESSQSGGQRGVLVAVSAASITIRSPLGRVLTYRLRPSTLVVPKLEQPPNRPYAPIRDFDNALTIADGARVLDHYELGERVDVQFEVVGPHRDDFRVTHIS